MIAKIPIQLPRTLALLLWATLLSGCDTPPLQPWHTVELQHEYSMQTSAQVQSLDDYLALETQLFRELDERVYNTTPTGPEMSLERYSRGSLADPATIAPRWNRTFVLQPEQAVGGVLLLHGMSDSPYSLRALAETLYRLDYLVVGLRMPGHGTIPSGMLDVSWQDMSAVVKLGMAYLAQAAEDSNLHIVGYSTGAALALDYALSAAQEPSLAAPKSLILLSPAIGLSPAAAAASWARRASSLPGLGRLAWLDVDAEFDPYKYNSFTTNAAEQVHSLTQSVTRRIHNTPQAAKALPPILIAKSTVDATVSNDAVVERLLLHLAPEKHRMLLFDINRFATNSALLREDPGPFTERVMADPELPFDLTLVTNIAPDSRDLVAVHKRGLSGGADRTEPLPMSWPQGVFSLSHVAIPFSDDDPLYGAHRPAKGKLFLGTQSLQGERDVLRISPDYLLRLRHNPFYDYMEENVLSWLGNPSLE